MHVANSSSLRLRAACRKLNETLTMVGRTAGGEKKKQDKKTRQSTESQYRFKGVCCTVVGRGKAEHPTNSLRWTHFPAALRALVFVAIVSSR